jgi:hypothetical protein
MILLNYSCVSNKKFIDHKTNQTLRIKLIENELVSFNSKINILSNEITTLNKYTNGIEKINNQNIELIKDKIKNLNDLISTLRIEVALLKAKTD